MLFRRHNSEEERGTEPVEIPEDVKLPDVLRIINKDGQEETGWMISTVNLTPTSDSEVKVMRRNAQGAMDEKSFRYGDIVKWNVIDKNKEEQNMAGPESTSEEPKAPGSGETRPVDPITGPKKSEEPVVEQQATSDEEDLASQSGKEEAETEATDERISSTRPSGPAHRTMTGEEKEARMEGVQRYPGETKTTTPQTGTESQPDAASWNYQAQKRAEWANRDQNTAETVAKANPLDMARRNMDIISNGEGTVNELGIKLGEGWRQIEALGELLEKLSKEDKKELPENFQKLKAAAMELKDRLQAELFRDESKRYETSNDRLTTNPEAEKILEALQELLMYLNELEEEARKTPLPEGPDKPSTPEDPNKPPTPEKPEKLEELTEPAELIDLRRRYTEMLIKNGSAIWLKRPKSDEEIALENEYHQALEKFTLEWAQNEVRKNQPELTGEAMNKRIIELVSIRQALEARNLAGVGAELYSESKYKKAIKWLRKHPKLRFLTGAALSAGTVTTAALGLWPATAAFAVAKGSLAGVSTAGGIGGGWEWLQNKKEAKRGTSAIYTDEEIQAMSEEEIMRNLSGNLARSLEKGTPIDDDSQRKATIEGLEAKRVQDINKRYQEMLKQGLTPEQIVAGVMSLDLRTEHLNHMDETERRGQTAAKKKVAEAVGGILVGLLAGLAPFGEHAHLAAQTGVEHAQPGVEHVQAATGHVPGTFEDYAPVKPEGVSLKDFAFRQVRMIMHKSGVRYTPQQQRTLAKGLFDMWQGPGNGVHGSGAFLMKSPRLPVMDSMVKAAFSHPRANF